MSFFNKSIHINTASDCVVAMQEHFEQDFLDVNTFTVSDFKKCLSEKKFAAWQHLVCEGLLLRKILQIGNYEGDVYPERLVDVPVFPGSPLTLNDLWEQPAAVAVFPLDGSIAGTPPELARLYLFKGLDESLPDHRQFFSPQSCEPFLNMGCKIFIQRHDLTNSPIDGNSWQLAAALALRAVNEKNSAHKRKLFTNYLISGGIEQDRETITEIKLGNKLNINQRSGRDCEWILPHQNQEKCGYLRVSDAWIHITGQGVKNEIFDLGEIETLHELVGESIRPIISVALLIHPKNLVLWYSDKTRNTALKIKEILHSNQYCCQNMQIKIMGISSDDISAAYDALKNELSAPGNNVCFNFTGGNRIMGFAAMLVARDQKVIVVYRDLDANKDTITMIKPFDSPMKSTIQLMDKGEYDNQKVNWDLLYSTDRNSDGEINAQSLWK